MRASSRAMSVLPRLRIFDGPNTVVVVGDGVLGGDVKRVTSRSSTSRGWVKPNRSTAEASCATCASECVRALRSYPVRVRTPTISMAAYLSRLSVRTG